MLRHSSSSSQHFAPDSVESSTEPGPETQQASVSYRKFRLFYSVLGSQPPQGRSRQIVEKGWLLPGNCQQSRASQQVT
eukprot:6189545-Pleurochrysis_carterae.AAC.2